jgi:hypothetical protein
MGLKKSLAARGNLSAREDISEKIFQRRYFRGDICQRRTIY